MENIHRLDGIQTQGGLVIRKKKKQPEDGEEKEKEEEEGDKKDFKAPMMPPTKKPSLLGLDKLAALREKERKEREQFKKIDKDKDGAVPKRYRDRQEETPTYTGGVNKDAIKRKEEREERERKRRKREDEDSRKDRRNKDSSSSSSSSSKDRRDKERDRGSSSERRGGGSERRDPSSSRESYGTKSAREREKDWEVETPGRNQDEDYDTPYIKLKDTPSNTNWDEDDITPGKMGAWDNLTPSIDGREDSDHPGGSSRRSSHSSRSSSSSRSHRYERLKETPLPTPTWKKNSWNNHRDRRDRDRSSRDRDRGSSRDHRRGGESSRRGGESSRGSRRDEGRSEEDFEAWEEEQKKLDREWYGMDEGYDETSNPFSAVSAEYTKKKEEAEQARRTKKMSAKQAQKNKDNEMWEKNRMFRSGAVTRTDYDEDFEEISEAKVHLLVHNIIPPFLDGRIVFTKQQEPVIPIKDPTSDMAMVSKKGSR